MTFSDKAKLIRLRMQNYTTSSVVNECLNALHDKRPVEHEGLRRPWVYCLILEWALELKPILNAKDASAENVRSLAQSLWDIQSDAVRLTSGQGYQAPLRKMLIPQIRFQTPYIERLFFLSRFAAMLLKQGSSQAPQNDFESIIGVDLDKFFVFALWLQINFTQTNAIFINYETILIQLYPYFTLNELIKLLKAVGGTLPELVFLTKQSKILNRVVHPSEYFDEPFLINKPVIVLPNGISTAHQHVLDIGISEFVLRTLKKADPQRFRDKFTATFEDYIHEVLKENNVQHLRECDIEKIYRQNGVQGKVVDFYIDEPNASLFIDAKGVEPKPQALTSDSGRFIRDKLKDYHFKGLEQISRCIEKLQESNFSGVSPIDKRYGLIITHQDFYIGDAADLYSYLEPLHQQTLVQTLNGSIHLKNIFFCTITDFEGIVKICIEENTTLCNFLEFCRIQQQTPQSRVFIMKQHVQNFGNQTGNGLIPIGSKVAEDMQNQLFNCLLTAFQQNSRFWG